MFVGQYPYVGSKNVGIKTCRKASVEEVSPDLEGVGHCIRDLKGIWLFKEDCASCQYHRKTTESPSVFH